MGDYSKIKKIYSNRIVKKVNIQTKLNTIQSNVGINQDENDYVQYINNHHIELQTRIESKIRELRDQLHAAQSQIAVAQARIDAAQAQAATALAQAAIDNSMSTDALQENLLLRRKINELTRVINEHETAVNRILDP
jgi:hypothetical protein